jgi:hypothetical protein
MFKSKLEAAIVVLLLFAIPPLSLVAANNIHTTKVESEVVNAKQ